MLHLFLHLPDWYYSSPAIYWKETFLGEINTLTVNMHCVGGSSKMHKPDNSTSGKKKAGAVIDHGGFGGESECGSGGREAV